MQASGFDWEWCDAVVDLGEVVPVLGPGLHRMEPEAGSPFLYDHLGEELARALGVEGECEPNGREPFLRTVAMQYLRHDPNQMGREIRRIWEELRPTPSKSLRQLARIPGFKLFVSTTFDSLMVQALNEERYGGRSETEDLAYSPKRVQDLPAGWKASGKAVVYHLLGRLSAIRDDYALSSEDVLEFLHSVPSKRKGKGSIKNLLNALEKSHLLLLGCGFSSWQSGYFMRTLTGAPLSTSATLKAVADADKGRDGKAMFLSAFGVHVYEDGDVDTFVDELSKRWEARHGAAPVAAPPGDDARNRVFVSYAREDESAAAALCSELKAHDFNVWLDLEALRAGSDWDRKIKDAIKSASIFIPCVSRNTEEETGESYVYGEWDLAVEHTRRFAPQSRYLWPVIFDDTRSPKNVPADFGRWQWSRLPGGRPTPEFLEELSQELCARTVGDFRLNRRD